MIKSINIGNVKTLSIRTHILKSLSNVNSFLVNIIVKVTQRMGNFSINLLTKNGNHSINQSNISTIGNESSSDNKEFPIGIPRIQPLTQTYLCKKHFITKIKTLLLHLLYQIRKHKLLLAITKSVTLKKNFLETV